MLLSSPGLWCCVLLAVTMETMAFPPSLSPTSSFSWSFIKASPKLDAITRTRELIHALALWSKPNAALGSFLGLTKRQMKLACRAPSSFSKRLALYHNQDGLDSSDLQSILEEGCFITLPVSKDTIHSYYRLQLHLVAHHAWLTSRHYLNQPSSVSSTPSTLTGWTREDRLLYHMLQYDVRVHFPFLALPEHVYTAYAMGTSKMPRNTVLHALQESSLDLGTSFSTYERLWHDLLVTKKNGKTVEEEYRREGGDHAKNYYHLTYSAHGKTPELLERYPKAWERRVRAVYTLMRMVKPEYAHLPLQPGAHIFPSNEELPDLFYWVTEAIWDRFMEFHKNALKVCQSDRANAQEGRFSLSVMIQALQGRDATLRGDAYWKEYFDREMEQLEKDLTLISMPILNLLTLITHRSSLRMSSKEIVGERPNGKGPLGFLYTRVPKGDGASGWDDVLEELDARALHIHQRLYPKILLEARFSSPHLIQNLARSLASDLLDSKGQVAMVRGEGEEEEESRLNHRLLNQAPLPSIVSLSSLTVHARGLYALSRSAEGSGSLALTPREDDWTRTAVREILVMVQGLRVCGKAARLSSKTFSALKGMHSFLDQRGLIKKEGGKPSSFISLRKKVLRSLGEALQEEVDHFLRQMGSCSPVSSSTSLMD